MPKDSVRVVIPGCTKGRIFTAGPRSIEEAGSVNIPEGMHLRMNGPKKLIEEITGSLDAAPERRHPSTLTAAQVPQHITTGSAPII